MFAIKKHLKKLKIKIKFLFTRHEKNNNKLIKNKNKIYRKKFLDYN